MTTARNKVRQEVWNVSYSLNNTVDEFIEILNTLKAEYPEEKLFFYVDTKEVHYRYDNDSSYLMEASIYYEREENDEEFAKRIDADNKWKISIEENERKQLALLMSKYKDAE